MHRGLLLGYNKPFNTIGVEVTWNWEITDVASTVRRIITHDNMSHSMR
jgi:hypothetical protein